MKTFVSLIQGKPIPQGSKTVASSGGKSWVRDANAATLKPWRAHVTKTIKQDNKENTHFEGAVDVLIWFHFIKPASAKRNHPTVKPDVDKLARAILDSASSAGLWRDDAQVIRLFVSKSYGPHESALLHVQEVTD